MDILKLETTPILPTSSTVRFRIDSGLVKSELTDSVYQIIKDTKFAGIDFLCEKTDNPKVSFSCSGKIDKDLILISFSTESRELSLILTPLDLSTNYKRNYQLVGNIAEEISNALSAAFGKDNVSSPAL